MFESWIGPEVFRTGVQRYLKQHAHRNATSGDFLDSLGSASRQGVTGAFSTFLEQPGVPVVTAALKCDGAPALSLRQERSLPLGSQGSRPQTWQIPVCARYEAGGALRRECVLFTSPAMEWKLPGFPARGAKGPEWVQANADAAGYYRVRYEGGLLAALLADGGKRNLDQVLEGIRLCSARKAAQAPGVAEFLKQY